MSRITRVRSAALALALAGAATPALAQIPGMPLFTNPRMATGIRVHADVGQPTGLDATDPEVRVLQAGVGIVLGPLGIDANVGTTKQTFDQASGCIESPSVPCADSRATVSALAQLKIFGGGRRNISVSLFGGGSIDLDTADAFAGGVAQNREVHIPVGVAIGVRVPLGLASLNLWGAPRYNLTRYVNCEGTCPTAPDGYFGWAVGADLPIFRVLSIRAAYDSSKPVAGGSAFNVVGVGVSFGFGGMR